MTETLLSVQALDAGYGNINALHGVSLEVREKQIVCLLGANGAGKSTTLRTVSGLIRPTAGSIRFLGEDISRLPPHKLPYMGLVHVPEGRRIFGEMSIQDNLEMGAFTLNDGAQKRRRMDHVYHLFPVLAKRRDKDAAFLSGGEQQMLAIGRAMMAGPRLLLMDEPSMGLAPLMIKEVLRIVKQLNDEGTTILLVEQNSKLALKFAHYGYVMETGRITTNGSPDALLADGAMVRAYLGATASV